MLTQHARQLQLTLQNKTLHPCPPSHPLCTLQGTGASAADMSTPTALPPHKIPRPALPQANARVLPLEVRHLPAQHMPPLAPRPSKQSPSLAASQRTCGSTGGESPPSPTTPRARRAAPGTSAASRAARHPKCTARPPMRPTPKGWG
eukprot:14676-Chlamydomonas_euryale.AAC.1